MLIQSINSETQQTNIRKNNQVSYKGIDARNVITALANPDTLTSTIALESCVTTGRGVNAYKRGGFAEFRERFTDDIVGALFWMCGVDIFNKIGNAIGKHILKLPITEFDVGKDALRDPVLNLSEKYSASVMKKLTAFKFTKIIASTLLATGFVGFVMPKINQKITKLMMSKKNAKSKNAQTLSDEILKANSFESFTNKIEKSKNVAFKGGASTVMTTVAHCLENNKICKLLTTDVGITSGRVMTARNKDEGLEYLFRDLSSAFFYYASTPLIYKGLQNLTKSSGLTTIDPVSAKMIREQMVSQFKDGAASVSVKEFTKNALGVLDDSAKNVLSSIKTDVITLDELKKIISDESVLQRAKQMAEKLQPARGGVSVLTKQQVEDVLRNGSINSPEFMEKIYKSKFGDALTNKAKFIPMKKINGFRKNINDYVNAVAKEAKGGEITADLIKKVDKKSFMMSAGFRIAALAVSAFALGVVIPKLQYYITKKRTGVNAAPGLREYETDNKQIKEDKK